VDRSLPRRRQPDPHVPLVDLPPVQNMLLAAISGPEPAGGSWYPRCEEELAVEASRLTKLAVGVTYPFIHQPRSEHPPPTWSNQFTKMNSLYRPEFR
jgi:hypothetical protein